MDDALRHLLETELRAEEIALAAERERESVIQQALEESRREQSQFQARVPELHAAFVNKAEARAGQTVSELRKRYDERYRHARAQAEQHEADAVDEAMELLLDPRF